MKAVKTFTCPDCKGKGGGILSPEDVGYTCKRCKGTGRIKVKR